MGVKELNNYHGINQDDKTNFWCNHFLARKHEILISIVYRYYNSVNSWLIEDKSGKRR